MSCPHRTYGRGASLQRLEGWQVRLPAREQRRDARLAAAKRLRARGGRGGCYGQIHEIVLYETHLR